MALTTEEKAAFRRSEVVEEIKDRSIEAGSTYTVSIQSLILGVGRTIVLEEEIKELARIIENVMDDTVIAKINWCEDHIIITRPGLV